MQTRLLFNNDFQLQHKQLTFNGNHRESRHAWIRLTPAYSVGLVGKIIDKYSPPFTVLDPFNGSGTTVLTCASRGLTSYGVELNPFLVWLAKVKATRYSDEDVRIFKNSVLTILRKAEQSHSSLWTPPIKNIEKWWDKTTLIHLSLIFDAIQETQKELPLKPSNLLKIAFCRTIIECSNAYYGHQSVSFKSKKFKVIKDVFKTYLESSALIIKSILNEPLITEPNIILGDSTCLGSIIPKNYIDQVITSPPYPNRMSYIRELRPYMYWLGYLNDGRQAGELDWSTIGGTWGIATSNLSKWRAPEESGTPKLQKVVSTIEKRSPILARYVEKYFIDMSIHVDQLFDVVAPNGKIHYIIGNSKFYDTLVPSEEFLASLFKNSGFEKVMIERIRKRNSKKELFEFLVYGEKP